MTTLSSKAGTKGVPRAAREQQILAAAAEEFGRHGYEATTVAAIAARVGVTKPLLHQYFGSKQDLYLACLDPIGERLLDAIRTAMAGHDTAAPPTPLRVLNALFTALDGQRRAWFVLYDPTLPPGSDAAQRAAHYRDAIDDLAATGTAELLRTAGTTDPLDADALKHAWRGLCTSLVRWWIDHPDQSPEAMTRRCTRLIEAAHTIFAAGDDNT
ncbi:TetR family transcriptional regulator [Streptomyces venezuelae]|uniref:TetR/AcrR family transcriptional regulator n=1 Tax=Streptomyces gardneri TaxID=66892 RepID=UPI0006BCF725|nr:TetR/AcrR family transcriptional regulator [Streptomyces gardneri]ALO13519.1 TetR family transcriptional regulator [Streptomyces venezuelae]QPK50138.1 TetR/AcrR family transcriptional regulator [Streptomyces gardneri]WRK41729.1 helix-turn-helix domain-containing protein [Streptomyces venezuelae]CUM35727.1 Transcriptional regulator, TetR family [Streptomyces venezuelae]